MLCEEEQLCIRGLKLCHCRVTESCKSEDFIKQGVGTLICVFCFVLFCFAQEEEEY